MGRMLALTRRIRFGRTSQIVHVHMDTMPGAVPAYTSRDTDTLELVRLAMTEIGDSLFHKVSCPTQPFRPRCWVPEP